MAEAHSAVAFSFSITHDGYNINYNREVLYLVWDSGVRSWKKRLARFRVGDFKILSHFLRIPLIISFRLAFEMASIPHIYKVFGL